MKLIILGCGRMGLAVENYCKQNGIQITCKIDSQQAFQNFCQQWDAAKHSNSISDESHNIVIDFTTADECGNRIFQLLKRGLFVVSGTTGWNLSKLHDFDYRENNNAFLHSSNFSIGVNIFWNILNKASNVFAKYNENVQKNASQQYDVYGYEMHHKRKTDSPSGTAITSESIINEHMKCKKFDSVRGGWDFGTHNVISREAFASGSIAVAQWLDGKCGCFTMRDFLNSCLD
jgi:4-hydroxy-tetrahydrodipicolinate reductase